MFQFPLALRNVCDDLNLRQMSCCPFMAKCGDVYMIQDLRSPLSGFIMERMASGHYVVTADEALPFPALLADCGV